MKTYNLFLFVVLPSLFIGCNNNSNTDWELYNLTGRIKSIQETTHKSTGTGGSLLNDLEKQHTIYTAFNKNGYKTEEVKYDSFGDLVEKMYYEYEYDDSGHKIKRYNYNTERDLISIYTYHYDKYGITEENRYNTEEELFLRKSYVVYLPDDFKVIEEKIYNAENNLVSETSCTYDRHGIKQLELRSNNFSFSLEGDENISLYQTIQYDEKGNKESIINHKLFVPTSTFDYFLDDKGNWTIRKEFAVDKLKSIVRREIKYY